MLFTPLLCCVVLSLRWPITDTKSTREPSAKSLYPLDSKSIEITQSLPFTSQANIQTSFGKTGQSSTGQAKTEPTTDYAEVSSFNGELTTENISMITTSLQPVPSTTPVGTTSTTPIPALGSTCKDSCVTTSLVCKSTNTAEKTCQCKEGYFQQNMSCRNRDELKVNNISVIYVGETVATLEWQAPHNPPEDIKYTVYYDSCMTALDSSDNLTSLTPGHMYTLYVTSLAMENKTIVNSTTITFRTEPSPVKIGITEGKVDSQNFTINFTPKHGEADHYNITVRDQNAQVVQSCTMQVENASGDSLQLEGLKSASAYVVTIITISGNHVSKPATMNFTTKDGKSGPVQKLAVNDVTSYSSTVVWSRPSNPNGEISAYELSLTVNSTCSCTFVLWCKIDTACQENITNDCDQIYIKHTNLTSIKTTGDRYQYNMTGLMSNTNYSVTVAAINNAGRGEIANILFRTNESESGPVQKLAVNDVTSYSSTVVWSRPSNPNGEISAYELSLTVNSTCSCTFVLWCKIDTACQENITNDCDQIYIKHTNLTSIKTTGDRYQYNMTGLMSNTNYSVTVAAINNAGRGEIANILFRTNESESGPVQKLAVNDVTSYSSTVVWSRPSNPNGEISAYELSLTVNSTCSCTFVLWCKIDTACQENITNDCDQIYIKHTNLTSIKTTGDRYQYNMTGLMSNTNYSVTVAAINNAGRGEIANILFRTNESESGPVQKLAVNDVTSYSSTVVWSRPSNPNGEISAYELSLTVNSTCSCTFVLWCKIDTACQENITNDCDQIYIKHTNLTSIKTTGDRYQYNMTGLMSNTNYSVTVAAINNAGRGEIANILFRTNESESGPVQKLAVNDLTSYSSTVVWSRPSNPNGEISAYELSLTVNSTCSCTFVLWCKIDTACQENITNDCDQIYIKHTNLTSIKTTGDRYQYNMTGLMSNTNYSVTVAAINNAGRGEIANILFRTNESESGPVQKLAVNDLTSYSSTVVWSRPSNPNGEISAYELSLTVNSTCSCTFVLWCKIDTACQENITNDCDQIYIKHTNLTSIKTTGDRYQYNMTGLMSNTNYSVTVAAINNAGRGEIANILFRTNESESGPVQKLTVNDLTSYSSTVVWSRPSNPNGEISAYELSLTVNSTCSCTFVLWCKIDTACQENITNDCDQIYIKHTNLTSIKTTGDRYQYNMTGLMSNTNYSVTVAAINNAGRGEIANILFRTNESEPGKVENLTVSTINNNYTSVTVTFSCPQEHQRNGYITHYTVTYEANNIWKESSCEIPPVQNMIGINVSSDPSCSYAVPVPVTPETNYTFMVQAFSTFRGNITEMVHVTRNGRSSQVENLEILNTTGDSITVGWSVPLQPNGHIHAYWLTVTSNRCHCSVMFTCTELDGSTERKARQKCKNAPLQTIPITNVQVSNTTYMYKIENLTSYTNYTVSMVVINKNGSGEETNDTAVTHIGVASRPKNFTADVKSSSEITLYWTPSKHKDGPTNYTIQYMEKDVKEVKTITVEGFSTSQHTVSNLSSFTNYTFNITAETSAGSQGVVQLRHHIRTLIAAASKPRNFSAVVKSSSEITLYWTPSKHKDGPTNYIIQYLERDPCTNDVKEMKNITVKGFNTSQHTVSNLSSYTYYTFNITAKTSAGSKGAIQLADAVRTLVAVPTPPTNVSARVLNNSAIMVTWMPPCHMAGPTSYTVCVMEAFNRSRTVFLPARCDITRKGYNETQASVGKLYSFWPYKFSVNANTTEGSSNQSKTTTAIWTQESAPDQVANLTVSSIPNNFTAVRLTWNCPDEKGRNGLIRNFTVDYHGLGAKPITIGSYDPDDPCKEPYSAILPVRPENSYNFTVLANTMYLGRHPCVKMFYAHPGKPPTQKSTEIFSTNPAGSTMTSTDSSFMVNIRSQLLTDMTNGHIVIVGLLVMKENTQIDLHINTSTMESWKSWKEWKKQDYSGTYRPTSDSWLLSKQRKKRSVSTGDTNEPSSYTVGEDSECDDETQKYCNGPVPADTSYSVVTVACTVVGCSASQPYGPFKTKPKSIVGGVVGGILGALVVIGAVIAVLLYMRRRSKGHDDEECSSNNGDDEEEESVDRSIPRKIADFTEIHKQLHKDSKLLFSKEWQQLNTATQKHPNDAAVIPANRCKNRYVNILAYDHTRVKLLPKDEDEGADYINANYVLGYSRQREYIASQGPTDATVDDFWQMVWEQNVPIIVMLTWLEENGAKKLAQYWPDELNAPRHYGEVIVELVNRSPLSKYTIMIFSIKVGTSEPRRVKHFFLQGWHDFNANLNVGDVVDFIRYVRNELRPTDKGPMLVHCSAGVGRTGTYICLDYFLQVIDNTVDLNDTVDIFTFVLKMRDCRPFMVQAEKQYVFIYDAVKEMIDRKKRMLFGEEDPVYQNQGYEPDEDPNNVYVNVDMTGEQ